MLCRHQEIDLFPFDQPTDQIQATNFEEDRESATISRNCKFSDQYLSRQRSHSNMQMSLSVEDLEAVSTSSSASGVTSGRMNGTRSAGVGIPRSMSAATILDILDPRPYPIDKGKKGSRFQSEHCVHLIPFVLILCYFFLWIASSGWNGLQTRWPVV
ncbi:hypothetical protein R1flu_021882 [Riccia fluitans]|uniref:Uncharacterized protein n=1 Tax=Riccia fluitans TaxID=41844 RepID=A0ABD1ZTL5_9MARC